MTDDQISSLVRLRLDYKQRKDFATADFVRNQLRTLNVELRDLNNQERMATAWSLGYDRGAVIMLDVNLVEDEDEDESTPGWFFSFPKGYEEPNDDLKTFYQRWLGKKGFFVSFEKNNGREIKKNPDAVMSDPEKMYFSMMCYIALQEMSRVTHDSRIPKDE